MDKGEVKVCHCHEKELPSVKCVSTGVSLESCFIVFLTFFASNLKISVGFRALTSSATLAVNLRERSLSNKPVNRKPIQRCWMPAESLFCNHHSSIISMLLI